MVKHYGSRGRYRRWVVLGAFLIPLLWVTYTMTRIYHYSSKQDHQPADAAIVLGAAIYRQRPSPVFRERINHAIELYQTGQVKYLIFTGEVGNRDAIAESEAARNYALQMGIPHEVILIETRSTNTTENLMQAKHLVGENDLGRVLVVSDPLHMKRAISIARFGLRRLSITHPHHPLSNLAQQIILFDT